MLALNAKDGGKRRFILCETEAYADTLTAERVRRVIHGYDYTGTQETELHPPEKVTWTTFAKDKNRNEILERVEGIESLERGNYDKIEKKITDGVLTIVGQKQVKEKMPGLGGSFTYVELGEAMDLERLRAETPGTLPGFAALARYLFFHRHRPHAPAGTDRPDAEENSRQEATGQASRCLRAAKRSGVHRRNGGVAHLPPLPARRGLAAQSRRGLHPHAGRSHRHRDARHRQTRARLRAGEIHFPQIAARAIGVAQGAGGLRAAPLRAAPGASGMKRLEYQEETVERFITYLETLVAKRDAVEKADRMLREMGNPQPPIDWCGQTWEALRASGVLPKAKDAGGAAYVPPWLHRVDGIGRPVPSVCLKLPTGAGKTYLATRSIEQLQRLYFRRAHGLVLWVVPSDAIYKQTWKSLADREHAYRMTLERASGGRVKLLRRGDAFTKADVES